MAIKQQKQKKELTKKVLKVGVLSIPTRFEYFYRISSGEERYMLEEYRNVMENVLKKELMPYLEKRGIELKIVNLGKHRFEGKHVVQETKILKRIARKLKNSHEECDEIFLLGTGHQAAWVLYHLPGKVAYVDQHFDAYDYNKYEEERTTMLDEANILYEVLENHRKNAEDIVAVGIKYKGSKRLADRCNVRRIRASALKNEEFEILDIDVDVFPEKIEDYPKLTKTEDRDITLPKTLYAHLSNKYMISLKRKNFSKDWVTRMSDIGQAIMHAKPRVVGICNMNPVGGKRVTHSLNALIRGVTRLAVVAAAERKFNIKLLKREKYKQIPLEDIFKR